VLFRSRKGERRAATPLAVRVPFLPSFPSGIVERRGGGLVQLTWFASPRLRARLWGGMEVVRNENHRRGERGARALLGAELRLGRRFLRGDID
jgi:hypothetical protein